MTPDLDPADIRALRGGRTRAAFAAEVGVDPHTIYRWELAADSPHARRPRGPAAARLRQLAAERDRDARFDRGAKDRGAEVDRGAGPDRSLRDRGADPLAITAALERMLDGEPREAESVFLRALSDPGLDDAARGLAATGLALIELLFRADSRRALAVLAPALGATAPPSPLAEATAALAYAFPDGELFDLGRVAAHGARVEALAARGDDSPTARALAVAAAVNAAILASDDELVARALARIEAIAAVTLPVVPALYLEQLRAVAASHAGNTRLATERLERMLADPRLAAVPPLEARVTALLAMRRLDDLGDPADALALARRARALARTAKLALGVHTALGLRAEAESLLRLGQLDEAAGVFVEADRICREQRFPVTVVLASEARYLLAAGRVDRLDEVAAMLAAIELPSMRPVAQAYAAWFAATALLAAGTDPAATLAAFTRADRMVRTWSLMRRDFLAAFAGAVLVVGQPAEARAIVERARAATERLSGAWALAHVRRAEGALLVMEGRVDEGRALFEATVATFEGAGDRLDAVLAGYGAAHMARLCGDLDGVERVARAEAALADLGLPQPIWIDRVLARFAARLDGRAPVATAIHGDALLERAVQRLAVAGGTLPMIARELAAVVAELTGAQTVVEREVGGVRRVLAGGVPGAAAGWFAVGETDGDRLQLGVEPAVDGERAAAVRLLARVASLAIELAAVRGSAAPAAVDDLAELPGLVVASPAMRRLMRDVASLAGSRATVVITGESGVGKEVIARALHDLSPRAAAPYVAFNCAAVPDELFEGQLFGYRKGAFTGAVADHPGVIRSADGGTLFLDEIGELPTAVQPKLLRFLENAEVFPLGAPRPIAVDVRVVAATNRDLAADVRRGRFREDLYYRLQVVPLVVPPLRDRKEDIAPLARHFARQLTTTGRPPAFAPDALAALAAQPWPGNVRELRNAIARAMAYAPVPDVITRRQLGL